MTPSTLPARLLAALDAADDQLSNLADDMKSSAYASLGDALQRIRDEAAAALSVAESREAVTQLEWSATLCNGKNVDYATAEKACAALGEGWRLPTRQELESILDLTRHKPAINTARFPDTKSDWYWTSTPCAWSPDCAWFVSFNYGDVSFDHRDYNYCCVRAVRSVPSGQHAAAPSAKGV